MILVNGQGAPEAERLSLRQYLEESGYRLDRVAVECNGEIVPRATYAERVLADGDHLEIVHFMGGG